MLDLFCWYLLLKNVFLSFVRHVFSACYSSFLLIRFSAKSYSSFGTRRETRSKYKPESVWIMRRYLEL